MEIDNKKILIGVGILVLGYLLLKKSKNNEQPFNIQTIVKDPSKAVVGRPMTEDELKKFQKADCEMEYARLAQPSVMQTPEYWRKRKEEWMKANCK
jgi:hypothetical protein